MASEKAKVQKPTKWELQEELEREKNKTANKIADLLVSLSYIEAKEILETALKVIEKRAVISQSDSTKFAQIFQGYHSTF